jgi:hypothetical protein
MLNNVINSALKAGWGGVRNVYRGIVGDVPGEGDERLSPARRLARDMRKHAYEFATGYQSEYVDGKLVSQFARKGEKAYRSRVGAAMDLVLGDMVLGSLGLALGWGVRKGVKLGAKAVSASARPVGHLAYQTYGLARDFTIGGGRMLYKTSKNPIGATALFVAPMGLALGGQLFDETQHYAVRKGLAEYTGMQVDSIPAAITGSPHVVDNFGADGNLVFAMHNLR